MRVRKWPEVLGWMLCASMGTVCQQVPSAQSASGQQPAGAAAAPVAEDATAPASTASGTLPLLGRVVAP